VVAGGVAAGVGDGEEAQSGLAVLADARENRATAAASSKTKDGSPKDEKRTPVGWIIAGVAAAILIVVGIVALVGGGGSDNELASSDESTTTTRRSESSTTSVSTTTTAPTTTTTEAPTTTAPAPTAPPTQNTTIVNVPPGPDGPRTPAALRVAAVTCPISSAPCTIPIGGTLTVTLINDGQSAGSYSLSGPGLQGPNGALTGGGSVSVTVRDTVEQHDRLATLTISGAGGLSQAVPVLVQ
jgi:hypothetical protein